MNCRKDCHNRKKYLFFLPVIVLLLVWLFFFVDINRRFPKPEETVVHVGESFLYHGFEVEIPQSGELLSFEEVIEKYQLDGKIPKGEMIDTKNSWEEYYCLDLLIKNQTEKAMEIPLDYTPQVWSLEMDQRHVNGSSGYLFLAANEHLLDTLAAGEEKEIHLIYGVAHKEWIQKSVRVYYSFYPTKNYIEQDILSEKEVKEEPKNTKVEAEENTEELSDEELLNQIAENNQIDNLLQEYSCIRAKLTGYRESETDLSANQEMIYMDNEKLYVYDFKHIDEEQQEFVPSDAYNMLYLYGNLYWVGMDGSVEKVQGDDIAYLKKCNESEFGFFKKENMNLILREESGGDLHIKINGAVSDYYPDEIGMDYQMCLANGVRDITVEYYLDKESYLIKQKIQEVFLPASGQNQYAKFEYIYGGESIDVPEGVEP